ncbi:MAG: hypothetical protein NC344_02110 [Bacteroidales bacterium]|nr:hypothetical protein [Bacteroidales bacterium]MCM1146626.1 hypothetical protein [Bacteroidales bacterium]MCM1206018.1 hypothetical protein [Bacillota bacterium]MCM1511081.1 hypothetical protein [Clostridium sp.]
MKSIEELFSRFGDLQELPVSEEMLGAYAEGNLSEGEVSEIIPVLNQDGILSIIMTSIKDAQYAENKFDFFSTYQIDFPDDDFFTNTYETEGTETMSRTSYNIYGEAGENIKDPVYILQPDDHSCALRSQQIVLRDFGIDIPFDKLEELALSSGVYTDQGTYTYDIGKVLQIAGVDMHQVQGTSFLDLTNELAQGHRIIVSVDANELWYTDPASKLKNWFNDAIGNQGGNHALIVAGVEVNPQNHNDVKVVLTDPGAGHLRVEYPLEQFMDAWKDSNCFMAATDNPAPYQYDANTGMEVPSNFMVQQYVNNFVASNGYQLSPDMINIPQDYQPAFTGHLDMVGDMDYQSFEDSYSEMSENRIPSSLSIKEQIEELAKSYHSEVRETTGSVGTDKTEKEETQDDEVDDDNEKTTDDADEEESDDNDDNDDEDSDDDEDSGESEEKSPGPEDDNDIDE